MRSVVHPPLRLPPSNVSVEKPSSVRSVRVGLGPVLYMLVLIRVWLLAGVSSPWLPSLGGDWRRDEMKKRTREEERKREWWGAP